jgi:hypothetical protein
MLYSTVDNKEYEWYSIDRYKIPSNTFLDKKLRGNRSTSSTNIPLTESINVDYSVNLLKRVNKYVNSYIHTRKIGEITRDLVDALDFLLAFAPDYDEAPYYDILSIIKHDRIMNIEMSYIKLDRCYDFTTFGFTAIFILSPRFRSQCLEQQGVTYLQFSFRPDINIISLYRWMKLDATIALGHTFVSILSYAQESIVPIIKYIQQENIKLPDEMDIIPIYDSLYFVSPLIIIRVVLGQSHSCTLLKNNLFKTADSDWSMPIVTVKDNQFTIDDEVIRYKSQMKANKKTTWMGIRFNLCDEVYQ